MPIRTPELAAKLQILYELRRNPAIGSSKQLAEHLGIAPANIAQWKTKDSISNRYYSRVCDAFNLNEDILTTEWKGREHFKKLLTTAWEQLNCVIKKAELDMVTRLEPFRSDNLFPLQRVSASRVGPIPPEEEIDGRTVVKRGSGFELTIVANSQWHVVVLDRNRRGLIDLLFPVARAHESDVIPNTQKLFVTEYVKKTDEPELHNILTIAYRPWWKPIKEISELLSGSETIDQTLWQFATKINHWDKSDFRASRIEYWVDD